MHFKLVNSVISKTWMTRAKAQQSADQPRQTVECKELRSGSKVTRGIRVAPAPSCGELVGEGSGE